MLLHHPERPVGMSPKLLLSFILHILFYLIEQAGINLKAILLRRP